MQAPKAGFCNSGAEIKCLAFIFTSDKTAWIAYTILGFETQFGSFSGVLASQNRMHFSVKALPEMEFPEQAPADEVLIPLLDWRK